MVMPLTPPATLAEWMRWMERRVTSQERRPMVNDNGPDAGSGGGSVPLTRFIYQQATPATVWTVPHDLATYPTVVVLDSANQEVFGDVEYLDENTVQLTFSAPFSGTAYLL
jgi:ABC-type transport system substrate-binding protein